MHTEYNDETLYIIMPAYRVFDPNNTNNNLAYAK